MHDDDVHDEALLPFVLQVHLTSIASRFRSTSIFRSADPTCPVSHDRKLLGRKGPSIAHLSIS